MASSSSTVDTKPDRYPMPPQDRIRAAQEDAILLLTKAGGELPGWDLVDQLYATGHRADAGAWAIHRLDALGELIACPLLESSMAKTGRYGGNFVCRLPSRNSKQPAAKRSKRTKQSTTQGDARAKIVAALTLHHEYDNGSCLEFEAIGVWPSPLKLIRAE